jgi:hypothetical protein
MIADSLYDLGVPQRLKPESDDAVVGTSRTRALPGFAKLSARVELVPFPVLPSCRHE